MHISSSSGPLVAAARGDLILSSVWRESKVFHIWTFRCRVCPALYIPAIFCSGPSDLEVRAVSWGQICQDGVNCFNLSLAVFEISNVDWVKDRLMFSCRPFAIFLSMFCRRIKETQPSWSAFQLPRRCWTLPGLRWSNFVKRRFWNLLLKYALKFAELYCCSHKVFPSYVELCAWAFQPQQYLMARSL